MGFKISQLPAIPSCQLTDLIAEVQPATGGTTYKATVQQLSNLIVSQVPPPAPAVFPYTDVTGTTQAMAINNGYVADNALGVTLTLPVTSPVGSRLEIVGSPTTGNWTIAQNAGQNIQVGIANSTVGVGGSVSSSNPSDSVVLICTVANTTWSVLGGPQSSDLNIV